MMPDKLTDYEDKSKLIKWQSHFNNLALNAL